MSRAHRLSPYVMSDHLSLELLDFDDPTQHEVQLDGVEVESEEGFEEFSRRNYDFSQVKTPWRKLSFRLKATLIADDLRLILPTTSDPARDSALVVSITCPSTKFRHGIRLELVDEGEWSGEAIIQRTDLRGTVLLRPTLVRVTDIHAKGDPGTNVATWAGAIIATGPGAAVYVDEPARSLHGAPEIVWEDFRRSTNDWRRTNDADVFNLEPYGDAPRLFLNERYGALRALLDIKGRRGIDAALRDLAGALIAQTVWVQLFVAAAGAVTYEEQGGATELPATGWRRDILMRFLPILYPGISHEQQLRQLGADLNDTSGIDTLMSRAGTAAQQMVGTFKMIESSIRARESARDSNEEAA